MFTLESIAQAHSKVISGADFPTYIQEIKKLGVFSYEVFVSDGHSKYSGANEYSLISPAKYKYLEIAWTSNTEQFQKDLTAHQQGKTDYATFCSDCAKSGVSGWVMDLETMLCTYVDAQGQEIFIEKIHNESKRRH